jgi:transcriptional regulator with XRE-family HTH domain
VDDLIERLGQRIRDLRTKKGWSQEQFANICGVHRTYMGHLERGEKNVSFHTIERVANALAVTLAELFAGLEQDQSDAAGNTPSAGPRPGAKKDRAGIDRERVLRELAVLERSLEALRATMMNDGPRNRPVRTQPSAHPRRTR